jgi:DNA (cytosine-5)-methyltransferase 1
LQSLNVTGLDGLSGKTYPVSCQVTEEGILEPSSGRWGELGYGFAYRVLDAQWFGVAQRRRRVFVIGHLGDWQRAAAVLFKSESVRRDTAPSREAGQEAAKCLTAGVEKRYDFETETLPIGFGAQMSNPQTDVDLMQTLNAKNPMAVAQPIAIHPHVVGRAPTSGPQGKEYIDDGSAYCMDARGVPQSVAQPVAFEPGSIARNAGPAGESLLAPTLRREMGDNQPAVRYGMQVRRLTPVECERLQGFPDGYTNIPWRKKSESPDGPRYKALGNSMAVPVMRWIGERINKVDNDPLA